MNLDNRAVIVAIRNSRPARRTRWFWPLFVARVAGIVLAGTFLMLALAAVENVIARRLGR
jgi:hypothetical protein